MVLKKRGNLMEDVRHINCCGSCCGEWKRRTNLSEYLINPHVKNYIIFTNSSTEICACDKMDFNVFGASTTPECTGTVTRQSWSLWYRKWWLPFTCTSKNPFRWRAFTTFSPVTRGSFMQQPDPWGSLRLQPVPVFSKFLRFQYIRWLLPRYWQAPCPSCPLQRCSREGRVRSPCSHQFHFYSSVLCIASVSVSYRIPVAWMNSISTRELKYLPVRCGVLDTGDISNQAHKRSRFRFSHPPLSVQRFGAGRWAVVGKICGECIAAMARYLTTSQKNSHWKKNSKKIRWTNQLNFR